LDGAPGGARFQWVQVPNPPSSGKDIAEGKGVHREVESEGSWMWGIYGVKGWRLVAASYIGHLPRLPFAGSGAGHMKKLDQFRLRHFPFQTFFLDL